MGFEKLTVINEKDCIKFKQKCWIERLEWREINDILMINGFSWLSNSKVALDQDAILFFCIYCIPTAAFFPCTIGAFRRRFTF